MATSYLGQDQIRETVWMDTYVYVCLGLSLGVFAKTARHSTTSIKIHREAVWVCVCVCRDACVHVPYIV